MGPAQVKVPTLKKYTEVFELAVRPEASPADLATSVARHFDGHLDVDEDEVLARFVNAVSLGGA